MKGTAISIVWGVFATSIALGMSFNRQDIELRLVATDSVCTVDSVTGKSGRLPLKAMLHNNSRECIYLLMPNEDNRDMRLPLIGWSVLEGDSGQHPLELWHDTSNTGEFTFTSSSLVTAGVPKKGSFELGEWIEFPSGLLPGTYRIVFYYQTYPMNAVKMNRPYYLYRYEYQCSLMSNEVRIRVVGK